jgi:hypothetical protein
MAIHISAVTRIWARERKKYIGRQFLIFGRLSIKALDIGGLENQIEFISKKQNCIYH